MIVTMIKSLRNHRLISDFFTPKSLSQFKKYLVIGFSTVAIEYVLFLLFKDFVFSWYHPWKYPRIGNSISFFINIFTQKQLTNETLGYLFANSVVFFFVFWFNFFMNRQWSFKSERKISKQLSVYLPLFVFNLFFTNTLLFIFSDYFGISPNISKIIVIGIIVPWNFIIYKKWVYV